MRFKVFQTSKSKLLNIVQPSEAYFGQKDISQCILVKSLVKDLFIPTKIIVCETVREHDGLAMSSRNVYLTLAERKAASILYRGLSAAQSIFENMAFMNEKATNEFLISEIMRIFGSEPLVTSVEYVSIASPYDMTEISLFDEMKEGKKKGAVISAAIRVGKVRLIDNILVGDAKSVVFAS